MVFRAQSGEIITEYTRSNSLPQSAQPVSSKHSSNGQLHTALHSAQRWRNQRSSSRLTSQFSPVFLLAVPLLLHGIITYTALTTGQNTFGISLHQKVVDPYFCFYLLYKDVFGQSPKALSCTASKQTHFAGAKEKSPPLTNSLATTWRLH